MKTALLSGIALILMGAALLGYDHYNYTTREAILKIGPITATAETSRSVAIPPLLGWLLIGGGACVLAFAAFSNKR